MKKILFPALTALVVIMSFSCKKFIKEELVSTLTYDYYKTDGGLEDLVRSAYAPLRYRFDNEQSYALWNFGIDEFVLGDQFNYSYYNTYDPRLNSSEPFLNSFWINNYDGINRSNLGIQLLSNYDNSASRTLGTEAQRKQRLGELYFLRALYYFQLVQQFGGIPIVLHPSDSARTDFSRASVANVYNAIISDLKFASDNLSATTSEQGRATKGAANHFLAKAYLTRGSAVTEQRGQKSTDMDSAAYYAEAVINAGGFVLEPDYMNLWVVVYPKGYPNVTVTIGSPPYNYDGVSGIASGDGSNLTKSNNSEEIIFAAQFSNNLGLASAPGTTAGGNRTHEYFMCQYDAGIPGLNRKNDTRFYKSFRTAFYANLVVTGAPKIGDTAALFIVNNKGTSLTAANIASYRYKVYARYYKNAA